MDILIAIDGSWAIFGSPVALLPDQINLLLSNYVSKSFVPLVRKSVHGADLSWQSACRFFGSENNQNIYVSA
jgi:hypothetical protein